jgi:hypothetical protein
MEQTLGVRVRRFAVSAEEQIAYLFRCYGDHPSTDQLSDDWNLAIEVLPKLFAKGLVSNDEAIAIAAVNERIAALARGDKSTHFGRHLSGNRYAI